MLLLFYSPSPSIDFLETILKVLAEKKLKQINESLSILPHDSWVLFWKKIIVLLLQFYSPRLPSPSIRFQKQYLRVLAE